MADASPRADTSTDDTEDRNPQVSYPNPLSYILACLETQILMIDTLMQFEAGQSNTKAASDSSDRSKEKNLDQKVRKFL